MTEPMYQMVQLRVTGPLGEALASAASQKGDIDFAVDAIKRLGQADTADATQMYALWSAALVAYGRIFLTDRRVRLDDGFLRGTSHEAAHRQLLELRNRHIAHQVLDTEQVRVIAFLTALELEPKSVEGLGPFMMKMIARNEELEADLGAALFVQERLHGIVQQASADCLSQLNSLPVADLYRRAQRGESVRLEPPANG